MDAWPFRNLQKASKKKRCALLGRDASVPQAHGLFCFPSDHTPPGKEVADHEKDLCAHPGSLPSGWCGDIPIRLIAHKMAIIRLRPADDRGRETWYPCSVKTWAQTPKEDTSNEILSVLRRRASARRPFFLPGVWGSPACIPDQFPRAGCSHPREAPEAKPEIPRRSRNRFQLRRLAEGLPLVTNNVREFERVPDLRLENWVE